MISPPAFRPLALLKGIGHDFLGGWRPLLLTHVLYSLLLVALLAPLASGAIRLLVSLSGEAALTDQDILWFALRPVGLLALVLGAALLISLTALRLAALTSIGLQVRHGRRPRTLAVLWSTLGRAPVVLRLTVVLLGLLGLVLGLVLLRLLVGWVHALPLALFAGRGPRPLWRSWPTSMWARVWMRGFATSGCPPSGRCWIWPGTALGC